MQNDEYIKTFEIEGLLEINRPTFPDDRGFFKETVRISHLNKLINKEFKIVQVNHARSFKNALRGIHIAPWNKLIYVTRGTVQAVIVDLRKDSKTFGKYQSFIIGEDNKASIFVPKGCGNAYLVLSSDADYTYLTDQEWAENMEHGIAWNDPDLNIDWKLDGEPVLSDKDKDNASFKSLLK
ncbi:MAG: dTDP-4-dehydrorhamnose 3,5-epimerase [Candidatus Levyibacteriota bacterium]